MQSIAIHRLQNTLLVQHGRCCEAERQGLSLKLDECRHQILAVEIDPQDGGVVSSQCQGFSGGHHQLNRVAFFHKGPAVQSWCHRLHGRRIQHLHVKGLAGAQATCIGGGDRHLCSSLQTAGGADNLAVVVDAQALGQALGTEAQAVVVVHIGESAGYIQLDAAALGQGLIGYGTLSSWRFIHIAHVDRDRLRHGVLLRIFNFHQQLEGFFRRSFIVRWFRKLQLAIGVEREEIGVRVIRITQKRPRQIRNLRNAQGDHFLRQIERIKCRYVAAGVGSLVNTQHLVHGHLHLVQRFFAEGFYHAVNNILRTFQSFRSICII